MKVLIATHNHGKFKELMEVLEELPFNFVSLNDEHIQEDVEENGHTYEENAIIKAEFFGKLTGLPTIADDSGIVIEALEGELGVKTRRWGAGAKASDKEWLDFFLERMSHEANKNAHFISVVAFYRPHQETLTFRGECKGVVMNEPETEIEPGIPLSSVFKPTGTDRVFSAMTKDEKNEISHRGIAIKKCYRYLMEKNWNQGD
ncbi:non-canonical purine NTP pyrophosphatase [Candidatus Peregrinibacteria bacterium]|nr:MAG: non-canonical purine NTP pyrophosphatase [Candidatus Peregrinibacteria bacterium]